MVEHHGRDRRLAISTSTHPNPNDEEPANAIYYYVVIRHLTDDSHAPHGWDGW